MPRSAARVLGPYANGDKWRLVILDGRSRKSLVANTQKEALRLRDDLRSKLKEYLSCTCGEALEEYLVSLEGNGVLADTVVKVRRMLEGFLPLEEPLNALLFERAERMYLEETQRLKPNGAPIAADTHHLLLRRVKHFYKWAAARRYVESSPFAEVRPVGRPRRGKPQLRIDEARRFVSYALVRAQALEVGATAALLQIFLGLRPTESVVRVVRDLDDDGQVLWVPFGKTENARRRLQVPDPLRGILLAHAAGKPADAPLLGPKGEVRHDRHALRRWLKQLCEGAGVPAVCPHSLRGLNATLALEAGATAHHVAAALGHASFATTARHYADASAVKNASLRKVADVLGNTDPSKERFDVHNLAALLREQLSQAELTLLCAKLLP